MRGETTRGRKLHTGGGEGLEGKSGGLPEIGRYPSMRVRDLARRNFGF